MWIFRRKVESCSMCMAFVQKKMNCEKVPWFAQSDWDCMKFDIWSFFGLLRLYQKALYACSPISNGLSFSVAFNLFFFLTSSLSVRRRNWWGPEARACRAVRSTHLWQGMEVSFPTHSALTVQTNHRDQEGWGTCELFPADSRFASGCAVIPRRHGKLLNHTIDLGL